MPFPSSEETLAKREKPARPTRWNNLLEKNFYEEELRLWEETCNMRAEEEVQKFVETEVVSSSHHKLTRLCGLLVNHSHYPVRSPEIAALLSQHPPVIRNVDLYKTVKKRTALHHVVRTRIGTDAVDVAELLISSGADTNLRDSTGRTPLIMSAERARIDWNLKKGERWTVSENDYRKRADDEGDGDETKSAEDSQQHIGALIAQCLLTTDSSSIDFVDGNRYGAIHYAVKRNDTVFLEALIKFGPDLNLMDGAGRTPVIIAAEENFNECLEMLLKAGASADSRFPNKPRDSLLNFYSRRGLARQVTMCVQYDAKDVMNDDGDTALTLASKGHQLCKIKKKNDAVKIGHESAVEVLKSAGYKTSSDMQSQADLAGIQVSEGEEGKEGGEEEESEKEEGFDGEKSPKRSGYFCFAKQKRTSKLKNDSAEETKNDIRAGLEEKKEKEE
ncbi:hypothetical protein TrST_g9490 [Triparma strigata]|uniref:Ankyrin repeat protein n=1 Tax=Triparma strigata TaxID=1606541 RepID=A0A9W7AW91_9STRA|nr:hypothetical protein TrST_g9490 [Triparma strigata]